MVHLAHPITARMIYRIAPYITGSVIVVFSLILFYCRFVHSGRVCSGDYLDSKSKKEKGYLIGQGYFIEAYATILSITIYFLWCCICFVSARNTAANTEKRKQQAQAATRLANVWWNRRMENTFATVAKPTFFICTDTFSSSMRET